MGHRRRSRPERHEARAERHEPRAERERPRRTRRKRVRTLEEQAYRVARKRANRRMALLFHEIVYGGVLLIILIATRSLRVTLIVAAAWGLGLLIHHLVAFSLPKLRQRWIAEELGREVRPAVDQERRAVEERKVRSLEELSASIAHEIRNPITAAKSLVQQMGEDPTAADNIGFANVALGELDRVERSISHLLRYARDEELRFESLEVADVVESALATFRDRIERSGVHVECDLANGTHARGDGEKLRRVLINLIGNSLDALEASKGETPTLWLSSGENLAGTEVWMRIRDNGVGMDCETLRKIFDPFYTTKNSGTGLGLALSKKVIEAHGGTIVVESEPELGTEFVIAFPRDPEGAER